MTTLATTSSARAPQRRMRESYPALLERLSELSVCKYHDPFTDIDWDAPEHAIEADDPRHCISEQHPLAQTAWYAQLDAATRARFGLAWLAQQLKYGIGFEAVLSRGLLEFCQTLPDGSLEFRYAMHEVIEEGRHSLMFQEYINRCQVATQPVGEVQRWIDDRVAHWGRSFPELFFFTVLAGELFIDDQNRELLRAPRAQVHPLLRQIVQIHVTEEARHVCFAERFLHEHLDALSPARRLLLQVRVPMIFGLSAELMLIPDARLVRRFGIPRAALRKAFGSGSEHRRQLSRVAQPVRALCAQHGLLSPAADWWWNRWGFID